MLELENLETGERESKNFTFTSILPNEKFADVSLNQYIQSLGGEEKTKDRKEHFSGFV